MESKNSCLKCPKCNNEMEEGLLADHSYLKFNKLSWGTALGILGQTVKKKRPVKTYRCKTCGYLESYTAEEE